MDRNPLVDDFINDQDASVINEKSYVETTSSDSKAVIVTYYYEGDSKPHHSARLLSNGRCVSKWGKGGLVEHAINEVVDGEISNKKYWKLNPAYREVRTDHQPMFSKIDEAVNNAPDGCYIYVDNCTFYYVDNINVQSGRELKIAKGANLQFSAGKKLEVNGKLSAEEVTFQKLYFASGSYNYWQGIKIYHDATIENCTIKNAYAGVRTISSQNVTIKDNEFRTCENGIYCSNDGYNLLIQSNSFYNMNSNAIFNINC